MPRSITIARFDRVTDNQAKPETLTWQQLRVLLITHEERTSKDGPLWSPTVYGDERRRSIANVIAVSCLVLDFDGGLMADEERWQEWEYVLHTTHSHSSEDPHWRAIFPFAEDVPASEWPEARERLVAQLGGQSADESCKDASRIYYLPSYPPQLPGAALRHQGRWIYPRRPAIDLLISQAKGNLYQGRNNAGMLLCCQLRDNRYTESEAESAAWHLQVEREKIRPDGKVDVYDEAEWIETVRKVYRDAPREPWKLRRAPASRPITQVELAPAAEAKATALPTENGLGLNDKGNAWRLVHQFGQDLRFCKQWGWLVWDGRRWENDERQQVNERAKAVVSTLFQEAANTPNDDHRKLMAAWAVRSGMKERILAMVRLAESDPSLSIRAADLDSDPWLLNVLNGTLDVRTGQMKAHNRADLITRLIPIHYNPEEKCLTFRQFISQIMASREDLIDYLHRWVGYCLTGDTSEQMLLFLHGMGANGKSTFLRVLQAVLGEYGKQAAPGLLLSHANDRHPTEIADLRGARLVVAVEVGEGKKLAEELVKQMTGGEPLKGRFMHRDFFEFFPEFKLMLAANHKPVIRGTDWGMWRRIPLLPFDVTFTEEGPYYRDPLLLEKLMIELPGILAWAVRGCQEWRQRGLSPPAAVVAASAAYRNEMDLVGDFLADCCDVGRALSASAAAIYEAYKQWAEMNGERTISQKMLANRLKERGYTTNLEGGDRLRVWRGISVRDTGHGDPRIN